MPAILMSTLPMPTLQRRTLRAFVVSSVCVALTLIANPVAAQRMPAHRNLYNGDCSFLFGDTFVPKDQKRFDKQNLHDYVKLLAENGVDTYLQNPNGQVPWYPSKRTDNILTGYVRGDREFFRGHFRPGLPPERLNPALDDTARFLNRFLDLQDDGVNWIDEISKACRQNKVSPWISIRMNDMHGANSWENSYMNCELQRDPKYRLNGIEVNPAHGVNRMIQALDYSHPEVRDYMLLIIRELVEDHDYEGLELDWLRCPFCINPPASQANLDTMTKWIGEVRRLTEAWAKATGRPYPLGLRLPCRLGLLKAIGLDVKAMVAAGHIDFVSFSNFWQTSWDEPLDGLRRELGDRVAIYGVVQDAPNWMEARDPARDKQGYRLLSASPELIRGNAAGKLALGADGIEQFNFFCTEEEGHNAAGRDQRARYDALRDLDKIDTLRGQPKHYALSSQTGVYDFPLWEQAEQVPCILEPQWKKAFRLPMCAEPNSDELELVIQVVIEKPAATSSDAKAETTPVNLPELGLSFNGSWPSFAGEPTDKLILPTGIFTHHVPQHIALNYRCRAADIREGWNEILVLHGARRPKTPEEATANRVKIVSVELTVGPAASRE